MGLLAAVLIALAGSAPRQALFDLYQRVTPAPVMSPKVQIVVIDPDSLAAIGGWPWSRSVMARLTEQITSRGAASVGFDFLFPQRDRNEPDLFASLFPTIEPDLADRIRTLPSMDRDFAHVIGRNRVVLARVGVAHHAFEEHRR